MAMMLNNGICRCCSSEGTFKDVKSKYHWMGEEEVYADMLKDCFDISLYMEERDDSGICEVCITQLRNASNFKKQVLHTEQQFLKVISKQTIEVPVIEAQIKIENPKYEEEMDVLSDHFADGDDLADPDFTPEITVVKLEEVKPKKRVRATASTSKVKNPAAAKKTAAAKRAEDDQDNLEEMSFVNISDVESVDESLNKQKQKMGVREPLVKHLANIRQILVCSNANPIRSHGGVGYMCCWCSEQFPDPADLKTHCAQAHTNEDKSTFLPNNTSYSYVVKLDITSLQCILCNKSMLSPEELLQHLKEIHNKEVYTDIERRIFPFKFDCDKLSCFYCSQEFNKFKVLQEHMNSHYRNFVCDVCDAGFVNKNYWARHKRIHAIGTFQCDQCSNTYSSHVKLRAHINYAHVYKKLKYRCRHCNELFKSYSRQQLHVAKVHGVELKTKCEVCQKGFSSPSELTKHLTSHLSEKKPNCIQRTHNKIKDISFMKCLVESVDNTTNKKEPKTGVRGPLVQHLANIRQILLCSNATPIRCHGGIGYMCWWCSDQYPKPADLKSHSIANHTKEEKAKFLLNQISSYVIKLDVTSLQCLLCNEDMVTPEQLLEHLQGIHDKEVYPDVEKRIFPFKFDSDKLRCFFCCQEFNKFKGLQEHMNSHYRNFVCEICNAGFVTRTYWTRHKKIHSLGTFQCDQCPKVYTSQVNLRAHVNYAHLYKRLKYRCRHCNELFASYSQQQVHLAKSHGVELKTKCQACQKTFPSQSELTFHVRKYHMMEKEHKCMFCNICFKTKWSLNDHMVTHTNSKEFQCDICKKSFGRKQTLTKHMRTHMVWNVVKCHYCLAMIKKTYFKRHMQKKHGYIFANQKVMDQN